MKVIIFFVSALLYTINISGQNPLRYHETFALFVKGHGFIKYADRKYGINLVWSEAPVFEWKFVRGSQHLPVSLNEPISLFNLTANDYIVYAEREYGINLKWLRDTKLTSSKDWLLEGSLTSGNPCLRLRNARQKRKNEKSYIAFGNREYGINLVWSSKPTDCNIQLLRDAVIVHYDSRPALPLASSNDIESYEQAMKQMDVIGTNFHEEQFIGMAPAERSGFLTISKHTNTWFPIDGYKRTICGKLTKYFPFDGSAWNDNDDDLNLNIVPTNDFKPLLKKATTVGNQRSGKNNTFTYIQAEIDVIDDPYKNVFFPNKRFAPQINKNVCVYGPLVSDKGHDHKPEIHTAEQIWWKSGNNYILSFMCDNSNRFDGLLDGNNTAITNLNNTGDDYDTDGGKISFAGPWAPKPITGSYAIAFRVQIGKERVHFDIQKLAGKNYEPTRHQPANAHFLIFKRDTIALVTESDHLDLSAKFEKVVQVHGPSPASGTFIQGFIVLQTKTGKPFTGYVNGSRNDEGGQLLIKVTKTVYNQPSFASFRELVRIKQDDIIPVQLEKNNFVLRD